MRHPPTFHHSHNAAGWPIWQPIMTLSSSVLPVRTERELLRVAFVCKDDQK